MMGERRKIVLDYQIPKAVEVARLFEREEIEEHKTVPDKECESWISMDKERPSTKPLNLIWAKTSDGHIFKAFYFLKSSICNWWPAEKRLDHENLGELMEWMYVEKGSNKEKSC